MSSRLIKNVSSSIFWDQYYIENDIGWDLGRVTPAFKDWCDNLSKPSKIFVPGCGNGYDPLYFSSQGHDVYAVDFSKIPINRIKKEAQKHKLQINVFLSDLFDLNESFCGQFDYVVEYTCFCAIAPDRREEYINNMFNVLKKGGEFIGFFFPLNKKKSEGGPPFGVDLNETINNFSLKFDLIESFKHSLSINPRVNSEQFVRFRKK